MQIEIIKFIQSFSSVGLDYIFEFITMLGEEVFYIMAFCLIYWCINKRGSYLLMISYFISTTLNLTLKNVFHTTRPINVEGIRSLRTNTATGYSFPSGHTQGATTFWMGIIYIFDKVWVKVSSIIMIILIGFSRLYLGVHWPIDVIGGIVFGAISFFVGLKLLLYIEKNKTYTHLYIFAIITIIGFAVYPEKNFAVAAGLITGFAIGYPIENKYINFTEKTTLVRQIIKFVMGVLGLLFIKFFLKAILPIHLVYDMIRYFVMAFWIIVVYPYLFSKLQKS